MRAYGGGPTAVAEKHGGEKATELKDSRAEVNKF